MASDREGTERRRREFRGQLRAFGRQPLMRGSLVERLRRCGRSNCACARDAGARHGGKFLTVQLDGRTHAVHVDVTARAGLPLVVETMRALGLEEVARQDLRMAKRESEFPPEQKLEALVTLIAAGGDRVEDIRILGEDKGLERLLGRPFPSPDALLGFLGQFHDPTCWANRLPEKKAYVPPESKGLVGLAAVNRALVARGADQRTTTATLDHDGTIIEAHKREALVAYEGTCGYQPLLAVWAEEQLIVADEFRE